MIQWKLIVITNDFEIPFIRYNRYLFSTSQVESHVRMERNSESLCSNVLQI